MVNSKQHTKNGRSYETDLEKRKRIVSEIRVFRAIKKAKKPVTYHDIFQIFRYQVSYPYSMVCKRMKDLEKKGIIIRVNTGRKKPLYFSLSQELSLGIRI